MHKPSTVDSLRHSSKASENVSSDRQCDERQTHELNDPDVSSGHKNFS